MCIHLPNLSRKLLCIVSKHHFNRKRNSLSEEPSTLHRDCRLRYYSENNLLHRSNIFQLCKTHKVIDKSRYMQCKHIRLNKTLQDIACKFLLREAQLEMKQAKASRYGIQIFGFHIVSRLAQEENFR